MSPRGEGERVAGAVTSEERIRLRPEKARKVRPGDYALRFAFGAAIALGAGVVSLALGPRAGGLFLAFPAILPASLTIIEQKEGRQAAGHDARGAILGAVGLAAFALAARLALPRLPGVAALLVALAAWVAVGVGAYLALRRLPVAGPRGALGGFGWLGRERAPR